MDFYIDLLTHSTGESFFLLFFKAFAVLFAVSYLVYAIVITRQTQIMNRTLTTKNSGFLFAVSFMQVGIGVLLIAVAVFLI